MKIKIKVTDDSHRPIMSERIDYDKSEKVDLFFQKLKKKLG